MKIVDFFRSHFHFWRGAPLVARYLASGSMMAPASSERHAASRPFMVLLGASTAVLVVGVFDYFLRPDVSTYYVLPVMLTAWHLGKQSALLIAVLATLVWLLADSLSGTAFHHPADPYWNALARLALFSGIAVVVARVRLLSHALENRVQERTGSWVAEITRRKEMEQELAEISRQEQERLGHELHDHLGAVLAGTAFRATSLAEALERRGAHESGAARQVVELVTATAGQVRRLARLLDPAAENGSFSSDLWQLAQEMETLFGISCSVQISGGEPPLTEKQKHQLHRIALEAARNAVQHGKARRIEILLRQKQGKLTLEVRNDGSPWSPSPQPLQGLGLRIMRYRAGTLGGALDIERGTDGRMGVICEIPIGSTGDSPEKGGRKLNMGILGDHVQEQGSGAGH